MKTVMELSENFSAMMAEKTTSDEPESKDSLLTKLVGGVLPLLTKANQQADAAAAGQMPGVAPQQVHPMQQIPQPRRQHRPANAVQHSHGAGVRPTHAQTPQPSPHQFRNPQGPGRVPAQRPTPPQGAPQAGPRHRTATFSAAALGFATFTDKRGQEPSTIGAEGRVPHDPRLESSEEFIKRVDAEIAESSAPTLKDAKGVHTMTEEEKQEAQQIKQVMPLIRGSEIYEKATPAQQAIVELAFPLIAVYINRDGITPEIVANFVLDECRPQGFTPKVLEKEFTFDFLLQIASNFGIGEEKREWFGEFYETIKDAARNDASGEEEHTLS